MERSRERNASIHTTIDHSAARWAAADKHILRAVFPLLAAGTPVAVERIVEASGTTRQRVEAALTAGRAGRDADGRVVELSGLTLRPTLHRVDVDGIALFGCCALLAHLTTFLFDRAVTIEPVDPVARHIIRLAVTSDRAAARNPRAVSTFVRTDAQSVAADVGANVCTHIHHFSSRQTADHAMARCSIVRVDAPMIRRGPSLVPARRATKVDQKAATRQRCKR